MKNSTAVKNINFRFNNGWPNVFLLTKTLDSMPNARLTDPSTLQCGHVPHCGVSCTCTNGASTSWSFECPRLIENRGLSQYSKDSCSSQLVVFVLSVPF